SLLAQEPTGIYQACIANGQLVGSVFTAAGYRLAGYSLAAKPSLPQGSWSQFYTPTTLSSTQPIQITGTPTYTSTRFRKTTGFFNLHSWRPELSDPAYTFTFLGNNILNTTQTEAYYTWNRNERSHALGGNFIYGGWYLQPFVAGQQTWGREVVFNRDTTFIYNETEVAAGIQLPLNLSFGRHYRRLVLSSSLHAEQVRWQGIGKNLLRNLDFNYLRLRAAYGSQIQRARQHIFPRFAYGAALDYRTIINQYTARQLLATANLTLPGFWQNHNILLTGAYQGRDTLRQYVFTNSFPFSRGYQVVNFPRMWRLGINYHLPLFYPEWGFGHMLYFLRVRANLFYDYTAAKSLRTGLITPFGTTGTEVYFDTRIWNQLPVTFGVRYSRLLNNELARPTQANRWELILPVDLF
ncbi:MAG TPA: hypothetical protein PKD90_09315, partial [Phnomibacter sp.]|nr:hypothetical protein [Phnomibacter sp.]